MKAKRKGKRRASLDDLPLASFSDIAFLLIIYFIVVTTLVKTRGVQLDIPAGEKSQAAEDQTNTVNLDEDRIAFNGDVVDLAALHERLKDLKLAEAATANDRVVIIEATDATVYDTWFQVCAMIRDEGGVVAFLEQEGEGAGGSEQPAEGGGP